MTAERDSLTGDTRAQTTSTLQAIRRTLVEQGLDPKRPPLTAAELRERALGPAFLDYMRKWEGFVAD